MHTVFFSWNIKCFRRLFNFIELQIYTHKDFMYVHTYLWTFKMFTHIFIFWQFRQRKATFRVISYSALQIHISRRAVLGKLKETFYSKSLYIVVTATQSHFTNLWHYNTAELSIEHCLERGKLGKSMGVGKQLQGEQIPHSKDGKQKRGLGLNKDYWQSLKGGLHSQVIYGCGTSNHSLEIKIPS